VELMLVDLLSTASVVKFVDSFKRSGERLDILVLNAGINNPTFGLSDDGYETKFVLPILFFL
jgi:NAD(P)-dependent dehydrogenase (short-subunit alcohol dehydrogenase family)